MAPTWHEAASGSEGESAIKIRPVSRVRAHEEVARQLRELMKNGVLKPDDRLPPERELARQFGVSRATIRQALSVLQTAGLVESQVGLGTFTRKAQPALNITSLAGALQAAQASLIEQLELRRIIEPQCASLAAERATEADLEQLDHYLSMQAKHIQESSFVDADSSFHLAIARATKNSLLVKMVEGIHELLRESRQLSWQAQGGDRPLQEHTEIRQAIINRQSQAAHDAMTRHILGVERLTLQALSELQRSGRKTGG